MNRASPLNEYLFCFDWLMLMGLLESIDIQYTHMGYNMSIRYPAHRYYIGTVRSNRESIWRKQNERNE